MNKGIRDLDSMPIDIKIKYSKILSLMAFIDNDYSQLKIGAFYRIINKIQLPSSHRIQLLNNIIRKEICFEEVFKEMDIDEILNFQERNIFRFSLMKDLIIIINADYIVTENEKRLLKDIQNYFDISEEQLSFFEDEYEMDRCFFDGNISKNRFEEISKNAVSTAAGLGIPLALICYSGTFKGLGYFGTVSGLRAVGRKKKTGKYALAVGIGASIALGIATYKALEYMIHIKKDENDKLLDLTKESMESLHRGTIDILQEDMNYFSNRSVDHNHDNEQEVKNSLEIVGLLKRVVATLENTGPVLI